MLISEFAEKLKKETRVAIICHIHPDGDAVGSMLALKNALISLGITADTFCDDCIPQKFSYLKGAENVKDEITEKYSALIAVDCGDLNRLGELGATFSEHKNTYNIDHHVSNTRYARYNVVIDSGANAENVFDLITALGVKIDKDSANALATGIVTDTGNFKHKNVTESTFNKAAKLLTLGADFNDIVYRNFSLQRKERALLFGKVMSHIRYLLDGKFAVATVTLNDLSESGAFPDETEGFIDFVMGISGVEVGACVMEIEKNKYRISLRSLSADVNAVASSFGGGGHILASGCKLNGEYEEVIDKLRFAVSKEIKE